ncbi:MAG TPA: TonB family protein [Gemmatimonadaceae bacterium]|jgi:TonB family protein
MPLPALTQQTIAGLLINERSHAPMGNAHLSLLDDSGHVVARTVSDSTRGEFFLDAPKAGRFTVSIVVGHGGLSLSPAFQLDSGQVIERTFAVPEFSQAVLDAYLPDDVTKQVAIVPGQGPLIRYPDDMRGKGRQAVVRVTFVIGADGRADMATFRLLGTVDPQFEDAVRVMVSRTRYIPAERDGTKVSQVYDQVVTFASNEDGRPHGPPAKDEISITVSGCRR